MSTYRLLWLLFVVVLPFGIFMWLVADAFWCLHKERKEKQEKQEKQGKQEGG